ncbi:DUF3558 domain-containing protein [Nocardia cyriacigeorgica]|nr:DUF3558 domain-containing protein [Nocardia cyriacigeorgica]
MRPRLQRVLSVDREALVRRWAVGAVVAAGALLAGGCGSDVEGTATPDGGGSSSTEASGQGQTQVLWDPCTEISDELLVQIGMRPETERSGVADVEVEGWKVCSWNNSDFGLTVYSTDNTVEAIRNKDGNKDFADVTVAGRQALQYRTDADQYDEDCDMAFSTTYGSVIVGTMNRASSKNVVAPCQRAGSAAEVLVPVLPD